MIAQSESTKQLQQKPAPRIYSAHLPGPAGIPQPRQGRHIPTPGEAQRNPGIQTPQQNKTPKGVTLIFSPVHLISCSPDLFRGDTSSTTHLSRPAGTRNSAIFLLLSGLIGKNLSTPEILPQIKRTHPLPFCLIPYALCLPFALCPAQPSRSNRDSALCPAQPPSRRAGTRDYAFPPLCLVPYASLSPQNKPISQTLLNTLFSAVYNTNIPQQEAQKQTHFNPFFAAKNNLFLTTGD
jgi:hypothetical protein